MSDMGGLQRVWGGCVDAHRGGEAVHPVLRPQAGVQRQRPQPLTHQAAIVEGHVQEALAEILQGDHHCAQLKLFFATSAMMLELASLLLPADYNGGSRSFTMATRTVRAVDALNLSMHMR